jgi:polyisoprenoid-binding protein YceI
MTTTTLTPDTLTGTWAIDPAHSRIGFSARHAMVATVHGSFGDAAGVLRLDGEDPTRSSAEVTIQAASIDTGVADRDAHLRSADFLDVETFPTLVFRSTGVRPDGEDYVMSGELTIRGKTRLVELTIEVEGTATDPFGNLRVGFEGHTVISRKDFGLTWNVALETGGFLVGDKVKISLDISAIRQS